MYFKESLFKAVSVWIVTSRQPRRVTSGRWNSATRKFTFQNSSHYNYVCICKRNPFSNQYTKTSPYASQKINPTTTAARILPTLPLPPPNPPLPPLPTASKTRVNINTSTALPLPPPPPPSPPPSPLPPPLSPQQSSRSRPQVAIVCIPEGSCVAGQLPTAFLIRPHATPVTPSTTLPALSSLKVHSPGCRVVVEPSPVGTCSSTVMSGRVRSMRETGSRSLKGKDSRSLREIGNRSLRGKD